MRAFSNAAEREAQDAREGFGDWMRRVRGDGPRSWFAPLYGLTVSSVQDLEQGRVLPSRAMVVLLTAIENDPLFMREIAREARENLELLEQARAAGYGRAAIK